MCTNKIKNVLDFPAILKWRVKHQCLLNFNWMQTLCLIHNKGIMFKSRDTLIKIIHRIFVPIATRLASINGRPYMACTSCADVNNVQSYDHEHALLLCPKVTKFWTSVETLLISNHQNMLCGVLQWNYKHNLVIDTCKLQIRSRPPRLCQ